MKRDELVLKRKCQNCFEKRSFVMPLFDLCLYYGPDHLLSIINIYEQYIEKISNDLKTSVGSNLVRFEVRFGFLRFGRFEVRFLGQIWRFGRFEVRFKGSANLSEPL